MKYIIFIFLTFVLQTIFAQDSSMAKPKFNYIEFNVNSTNFINSGYLKIKSFNSINSGVKIGHHKITIGFELNVQYSSFNNYVQYQERLNTNIYTPNFKANYFLYFSKNQKKVNHFMMLNFNTQKIKDHLNNESTLNYFEYKTGYAYGLGYGATFYFKKHFLIEPSLLINTLFFKDKQIYKTVTYLTTTYTEEITPRHVYYIGISLKLGYIIPFKNK